MAEKGREGKKQILWLVSLTVLAILVIAFVDLVVRPSYWVKTMVKAPIFFCVPLLYRKINPSFTPFDPLKGTLGGLKLSALLGGGIYLVMMGCYFGVNQVADLSGIRTSLEGNLGINQTNFLAVGLYVSLCNSFLEEWFFRGFLFRGLKGVSRPLGYGVSSLAFAVYHLAIMDGMFQPLVLLLALTGLVVGGLIFNWLLERNHTLYPPWFCHMFANFAMNTIGWILFSGDL